MRPFPIAVAITLTVLASIALGRTAQADTQIRAFQVSCLPEVGLFEVRALGTFDESRDFSAAPIHDLTEARYALYSPLWAFYQLGKKPEERDDPLVALTTRFDCQLGAYKLQLLVAPLPAGRYNDVSDIRVSLSIAGHWAVDDVPFEPCDDRGPITRLAFERDQHAIVLEGRFGGVWPERFTPWDAWNNRSRRFRLEGYDLDDWVAAMDAQETSALPLTPKAIDYFQDESSDSYGWPLTECYAIPWTPMQKS